MSRYEKDRMERLTSLVEGEAGTSRGREARAMFEFLVRRGAWPGCRDWDGLSIEARAAFIDLAAIYATQILGDPR